MEPALPPLCWVSGVQTDAALGPPRPPAHVSRAVVTNLRYAAWRVTHTLVHTHTRTHTHVSCWWLLWTALTGALVAPFSPRKVRRSVSRPLGSGPWGGPTRASTWRRPGHSGPIFPVSLQACVSASPAVGPRWPAATRVPIQLRSQACGAPADPSEGPAAVRRWPRWPSALGANAPHWPRSPALFLPLCPRPTSFLLASLSPLCLECRAGSLSRLDPPRTPPSSHSGPLPPCSSASLFQAPWAFRPFLESR